MAQVVLLIFLSLFREKKKAGSERTRARIAGRIFSSQWRSHVISNALNLKAFICNRIITTAGLR